jgi:hypothetical protein
VNASVRDPGEVSGITEPKAMLSPIKRFRPGMGSVVLVKRQELVDCTSFIVSVINLRAGRIENPRGRCLRAPFFWSMMAKTVAVTAPTVA